MAGVACSVAFPDGSWALGSFDVPIAQQLLELDACQSRADSRQDFDDIVGVLSSAKGFKRFHQRLRRIAAGPVLRDAASGLVINNSSLGGSLGEMAAHVAAARGHAAILEAELGCRSQCGGSHQ